MEISSIDLDKKTIRFALWYARQKIAEGKNPKQIHEDMVNCGNPVIKKIMKEIYDGLNEIKERPQRERTKEVAEFFLWILYKDTAYRQPFFYILNEIFKNQKEIGKGMDKYVTEPKDWYVNRWHDSKEMTKKQREEGKLSNIDLSNAELVYVPTRQSQTFKQIYNEMEKKRKRWW